MERRGEKDSLGASSDGGGEDPRLPGNGWVEAGGKTPGFLSADSLRIYRWGLS